MAKAKYKQKIKGNLDSFQLGFSVVNIGKMFGYPVYYVWKKFLPAFMMLVLG